MISAMPALLSAPSRVVPEAVMMVLPVFSSKYGLSLGFQDDVFACGQDHVLALVVFMELGLTPVPETAGDVSIWAIRAMVGDFVLLVGLQAGQHVSPLG